MGSGREEMFLELGTGIRPASGLGKLGARTWMEEVERGEEVWAWWKIDEVLDVVERTEDL